LNEERLRLQEEENEITITTRVINKHQESIEKQQKSYSSIQRNNLVQKEHLLNSKGFFNRFEQATHNLVKIYSNIHETMPLESIKLDNFFHISSSQLSHLTVRDCLKFYEPKINSDQINVNNILFNDVDYDFNEIELYLYKNDMNNDISLKKYLTFLNYNVQFGKSAASFNDSILKESINEINHTIMERAAEIVNIRREALIRGQNNDTKNKLIELIKSEYGSSDVDKKMYQNFLRVFLTTKKLEMDLKQVMDHVTCFENEVKSLEKASRNLQNKLIKINEINDELHRNQIEISQLIEFNSNNLTETVRQSIKQMKIPFQSLFDIKHSFSKFEIAAMDNSMLEKNLEQYKKQLNLSENQTCSNSNVTMISKVQTVKLNSYSSKFYILNAFMDTFKKLQNNLKSLNDLNFENAAKWSTLDDYSTLLSDLLNRSIDFDENTLKQYVKSLNQVCLELNKTRLDLNQVIKLSFFI
jgi:hypothetical protein